MQLPISVLDLSPVSRGATPTQAIRESIELAILADKLGYTRYWFAEHHGIRTTAASSPEVMIAYAAAKTERIRVGAGGMMLPNHAPLHLVEMFRTLEALHPGRIDLGLGRSPGADAVTSSALRRGDELDLDGVLDELLAFEDGQFSIHHPFAKIVPMPFDVGCPSIWMLGATVAGSGIGAQRGVPYAFAGHWGMRNAREAIAQYREGFVPSRRLATPYALCTVSVICGADEEDARRLAAPYRVSVVNQRAGRREPVPSVEEAVARTFTPEEQAIIDESFADVVIGGPDRVRDGLRSLAREIGADELMISLLAPTFEARCRSFERIAAAMALSPR
ncbi:MAG TPA: LLM class flavin-dependent oxidoreductase [Kofleriaceae bacterium]|nr:LLM class flavin-dependent oxidoreductase [Kofleriaceae bacterium]